MNKYFAKIFESVNFGFGNLFQLLKKKFFVDEQLWLSLPPSEAERERKAHLTCFLAFLTALTVQVDNLANLWVLISKFINYDMSFDYRTEIAFDLMEQALVFACFFVALSNIITAKNYHRVTLVLSVFGLILISYAYLGTAFFTSLLFYYVFICSMVAILLDRRTLFIAAAFTTLFLTGLRLEYLKIGQTIVQAGLVYSLLGVVIIVIVVRVPASNQVKLLLAKNKQLEEARRRSLEARELERIRLANELHDDGLAKINQLLGLITNKETLARSELKKVQALSLLIENSVRATTRNLHAPELDLFPLYIAIPTLAYSFCGEHKLELTLDIDDFLAGQFFARQLETTVYRIIQQSLDNIVKHSQASFVEIKLTWNKPKQHLFLEIADNGVGFHAPKNLKQFKSGNHFGLSGIFERINDLSGTLEIISNLGQGTRIIAVLPVLSRLDENDFF